MSAAEPPHDDTATAHKERLATFRITEDEVLLLALVRRAKRDAGKRTHRVALEIDSSGIYIVEQSAFMRAPLA